MTVNLPRILIAGAIAMSLTSMAVAQEQSLGDVARKNRKSGNAKVLTNEDMPTNSDGVSSVGQAPAASNSSGSSSTAASSSADEANVAAGERDKEPAAAGEAASTSEVTTMEKRLQKLSYDEAGLERRIAKMEVELEEAETEFRREMYRTGLENARNNLENIRGQKEATEKALADARKSKPGTEAAAAPAPQQPAASGQQPE
jgi:chromosome segregation ATPase